MHYSSPRLGFGRIVALFLLGLSPIVAWIVAWIVAFPQLCDMKVKTLSIGGKRQSDQTPSAGFVLTDVLYDSHASDSRLSAPNGC